MDINKIEKQVNGKFNKTEAASKGKQASPAGSKASPVNTDRVTLSNFQFRNSEQLFVKVELEKLNHSEADRFKEIKSQLAEFKKASPEKAEQTEIGKKINDPSVWEDIAHKILK